MLVTEQEEKITLGYGFKINYGVIRYHGPEELRSDYFKWVYAGRSEEEILEIVKKHTDISLDCVPIEALSYDEKIKKDLLQRKIFLKKELRKYYPSFKDERVDHTDLFILKNDFFEASKGSIVYYKKTNFAEIYYIFPIITLNEIGVHNFNEQFSLKPKEIIKPAESTESMEMSLATNSSIIDSLIDASLSFAATASFAIPPPWGVLVSASLGVVLFAHRKMEAASKSSKNDGVIKAIKSIIISEDIEKIAARLQAISDEMRDYYETYKKFGEISVPIDRVIASLHSYLINEENLAADIKLLKTSSHQYRGFPVFMMAASTHLMLLRQLITLNTQKEGHVDLYGIVQFKNTSAEYIEYATKYLEEAKQKCENIGPVYNDTYYSPDHTHYLSTWKFKDNNSGKLYEFEDPPPPICCGKPSTCEIEAKNARHNCIVSYFLDYDHINKYFLTLEKWKENYYDWLKNMPPVSQNGNVTVKEWTSSIPPESSTKWKKGNKVRYAYQFNNNKGHSSIFWSDWITIEDKACPVLNVPINTKDQVVKTRTIYRQFKIKGDKKKQIEEILAILPDNTTTEYTDQKVNNPVSA